MGEKGKKMRRWTLLAVLASTAILAVWTGCSNPNLAGGKLHFEQAGHLEEPDRTARFHRALDTFHQAVREMPQSAEARLWLGRTFAELDEPDSAAVAFDQAAKLDPTMKDVEDARAHYWSVKYNSGLGAFRGLQGQERRRPGGVPGRLPRRSPAVQQGRDLQPRSRRNLHQHRQDLPESGLGRHRHHHAQEGALHRPQGREGEGHPL